MLESNKKDREIEFANIKSMLSKLSSDGAGKPQETYEELASEFQNANFSSSPNEYSFASWQSSPNAAYTTTTSTGLSSIYLPLNSTASYEMTTNMTAGTLELKGKNADIIINGTSMLKCLDKICERLNILTPNPTLENEWHQLKELGEQYRSLENKLKEQNAMWEKLKSMSKSEL